MRAGEFSSDGAAGAKARSTVFDLQASSEIGDATPLGLNAQRRFLLTLSTG